jgi:phage-related protein
LSSIENEVVSLTFDSSGFERGINNVLVSLAELKSSLDFSRTQTGFESLQESADSFDLSHIESALGTIQSRFSALGAAAFTAIQSVTRSAIDMGKQILESTAGQILSGGKQRALAIEQARFQFQGLGQDVEASMNSALEAVRGTAFGLDEAATLAAAFGGAGITAGDQLTGALRGVAGVASVFGQSFADIGTIFQDVAAAGELTGAHLFSFTARGIGIAQKLGEAWGMSIEEVKDAAANGEITFEEFANTISELFGDQATRANETYSGSLDNLHAAMNRLGADIQAPKLEATRNVFNALAPAIDKVNEALEPLFQLWKQFVNIQAFKTINFLEGIDFSILENVVPDIVRMLQNLYKAVGSFLRPIQAAFQSVFGGISGKGVEDLALSLKRFTRGLQLGGEAAARVKGIFSGVFAALSIGFEVVKGIIGLFYSAAAALFSSGEGIAQFGSNLGLTLVKAKEFLVNGGRIQDFFENLGDRIYEFISKIDLPGFFSDVADAIGDALSIIGDFFSGADDSGTVVDRLGQRMNTLTSIIGGVIAAYGWLMDKVIEFATGVRGFLEPAIDYIHEAFGGLGTSIADSLQEGDFSQILDVLNIGVIGGLALALKKFVDKGFGLNLVFSSNMISQLEDIFQGLTDTLGAMQQEIKSRALMNIAKAVGLLTISVVALSLIDSGDLTKSLTAMAVGFGELVATFAILDKIVLSPVGAGKLATLSSALIALSIAVLILSFAMTRMSKLGWEEIAKGLLSVAGMLLAIGIGSRVLLTQSKGMFTTGLGLIAIGVGLNVVALAVAFMSKLKWSEMAQGLIGIGLALGIIGGALHAFPDDMIRTSAGLLLVSLSLIAISAAMHLMAMLDWEEMARGLVGIAGALILLSVAAKAMSGSVPGAVAIGVMSVALIALAFALRQFSDLGWDEILRGLVGMGAALLIVGLAGLTLGSIAPELLALGIALIPFAAGLIALGIALKIIGDLSLAQIITGIVTLAVALTLIGVGSILLVEAIPFIAALGLALVFLGAGFLAMGAGVYLAAKALEILVSLGDEAVVTIQNMLTAIIRMMPDLLTELAEGIVAFLDVVLDALPEIIEGLVKVIGDVLAGIIELAPQYLEAFGTLITAVLAFLVEKTPEFVAAGLKMVMSMGQGLLQAMPSLVAIGARLIISFLTSIRAYIPQITAAAGSIIVAIINGMSASMNRIVQAGVRLVVSFINGVRSGAGQIIAAGVNLIVSIIQGIGSSINRIVQNGVQVIERFLQGIRQASRRLTQAAFDLVIGLMNDLADAIDNNAEQVGAAAGRLGGAIIDGIVDAIASAAGEIASALADAAGDAVSNAIDLIPGLGSPMRLGRLMIEGVAKGMEDHSPIVEAATNVNDTFLKSFNDMAKSASDAMDGMDALEPVITPVLDLSLVEKKANMLSYILDKGIVLDLSDQQAQAVAGLPTTKPDSFEHAPTGATSITFEQTINAPKQLSTADIYRQTKGQIALAREELATL